MRVENPSLTQVPSRPSDAPWTVKAFAVSSVLGLIFWVVLGWDDGLTRILLPAILNAAIVIGMLKGYRGAWSVAIFFAALSVFGTVGIVQSWFDGDRADMYEEAISLFFYLGSTAMLLHPLTRDWVRR